MKIRYYIDGVSELSDDVEVVAMSDRYCYILKSPTLLYGISMDLIPVKVHANSADNPPTPVEYIKTYLDRSDFNDPVMDLEYHLPSLDHTN